MFLAEICRGEQDLAVAASMLHFTLTVSFLEGPYGPLKFNDNRLFITRGLMLSIA